MCLRWRKSLMILRHGEITERFRYLLLITSRGVIAMTFGGATWPWFSALAASFRQITQTLQRKP
jgi:hypothetical protein